MPRNVNEVKLAGRAGKDAVRFGNGPFKFSLATGGGKKKDGSGEWPTQWHNVRVWPNRVSGAELVVKGAWIEVEGRLEYESWTDKTSGQKKTQAVVVASNLSVGDSDGGNREPQQVPLVPQSSSAPGQRVPEYSQVITDDDIPFSRGYVARRA